MVCVFVRACILAACDDTPKRTDNSFIHMRGVGLLFKLVVIAQNINPITLSLSLTA